MNSVSKTQSSSFEEEIAAQFEAVSDQLPALAVTQVPRRGALARFQALGLPHRHVEAWKYSDLRAHCITLLPLAPRPSLRLVTTLLSKHPSLFSSLSPYRLVIVNGFFVPELSDEVQIREAGVVIEDVTTLFELGTAAEVATFLSSPTLAWEESVLALNAVFVQGGVQIEIPDGCRLERPIELVSLTYADVPSVVYTRNRIRLGAGASATVLSTRKEGGGAEALPHQTHAVTKIELSEAAKLLYLQLQAEEKESLQTASVCTELASGAQLTQFSFTTGAGFSRNQSFVSFSGPGGRADLLGIQMLRDTQHADQTLIVDHAVPHCVSREHFKTVLDDAASGVFQGKIVVRPHAQKTDGRMRTQALLLSEEARMANKPELEIFADDVQCAHGATSGQIDEDLLFYLRARGIPELQARSLLVMAFLSEVIEEIEGQEGLVEALEMQARAWLEETHAFEQVAEAKRA